MTRSTNCTPAQDDTTVTFSKEQQRSRAQPSSTNPIRPNPDFLQAKNGSSQVIALGDTKTKREVYRPQSRRAPIPKVTIPENSQEQSRDGQTQLSPSNLTPTHLQRWQQTHKGADGKSSKENIQFERGQNSHKLRYLCGGTTPKTLFRGTKGASI